MTLTIPYQGDKGVNCVDDIGETVRKINERIKDHTGTDTNSHLLKHSIEKGHKPLEVID